jgi:hypothetical protein
LRIIVLIILIIAYEVKEMKLLIRTLSLLFICSLYSSAFAATKNEEKKYIAYSSIDKTNFVRLIIEDKHDVFLITRPHSWGKSANLAKLQKFFAPLRNSVGEAVPSFKRRRLDELGQNKIGGESRLMEEYFFQYPVVSISLDPVQIKSKKHLRDELTYYIKNLFYLYDFIGDSHDLTNEERDKFGRYDYHNKDKLTDEEIIDSLRYLSQILHKHFGKRSLVLVNKYDNFVRYWHINNNRPNDNDKALLEDIKNLTGKMLARVLHDNKHLYKGIIIGVTDVTDMKIFDQIPGTSKDSLLNPTFADDFGFDEKEILAFFKEFNLQVTDEDMKEIKRHYGGYRLANQDIYNPAAINYMARYFQRDGRPAYDFNRLIAIHSDFCPDKRQKELKSLLDGKSLDVTLNPKAGYESLNSKGDDFYSLLILEGFLTYKNLQKQENGTYKAKVFIPNIEMRNAFRDVYEKHNPDNKEAKTIYMHLGNI